MLQRCTFTLQPLVTIDPAADALSQATVVSPADTAKTPRMAIESPTLVRACSLYFLLETHQVTRASGGSGQVVPSSTVGVDGCIAALLDVLLR